MIHKRFKPAFTLLELIFVIVILGIVASIGSELIVRVYQQYIVQRAQHRASIKTELAATQIANRLASAIPGTVYRVRTTYPTDPYEPIDSNFPGTTTGDDYMGIKWVGSDTDSFNATATPGWSGFCDINASNTDINISTPGSNLSLTNTIIQKLSSGTGSKSLTAAAIYFPYFTTENNISAFTNTTITFASNNDSRIVEHYKLAWSSYALMVDQTDGHLYLYYNFSPSPLAAVGTTRSLIMKNISTFKFKGAGRTIRFKICKEEEIGEDYNITACKEKAVF